jgi:hypothetical protein
MFMNKIYALIIVLFSGIFIISCIDNDTTTEQVTSADISGSVNLYDEGTVKVDNSGMVVRIDGLIPFVSATTNSDGKFLLENVPFGTYNLVYEKQGYGTYKNPKTEHINKGLSTVLTFTPSLGQKSTTDITKVEATRNGNDVVISVTTNPAGNNGNPKYIRFFLNTTSNVSSEKYLYYSPGLVSKINPYDITLKQTDLLQMGFTSGKTVFVKVYGDSFWSNEYEDPTLKLKVFPNLKNNTVEAVSFVVP